MANQFGQKIKQLREAKDLFQREVVGDLNMDIPMLSKIENGERKAKKEQVLLFAKVYKANKNELLTLWLADQLVDVVQYEPVALQAMQVAENEVKYQMSRK